MLLPQLMPTDTCKAMAYVCKTLVDNRTVVHHPNHPLAMPNSVVLDIFEDPAIDDMPSLQVVNVYHPPAHNHSLGYLFHYHIDDMTPTLLIGDFKAGKNNKRFYKEVIAAAENIWEQYLAEREAEDKAK